ncbi:hypothetical protein M011DRAFT_92126 [Sporormia fimetaria CBS 119925]|uniref:Uncharacterized protein n=1 Tax=Sporormia fimetaria CBS 119925 TaxID=1340428 RepID=A0A6A6V9A7_9PLEO|nr:hypothetical protein M011DRAFT_92126 [Sporormia fimetaria CBS 119925]
MSEGEHWLRCLLLALLLWLPVARLTWPTSSFRYFIRSSTSRPGCWSRWSFDVFPLGILFDRRGFPLSTRGFSPGCRLCKDCSAAPGLGLRAWAPGPWFPSSLHFDKVLHTGIFYKDTIRLGFCFILFLAGWAGLGVSRYS